MGGAAPASLDNGYVKLVGTGLFILEIMMPIGTGIADVLRKKYFMGANFKSQELGGSFF